MEFELSTALLVSRLTGYGALACLGISMAVSLRRMIRARRWWGMRGAELALAHGLWGIWIFLGWGDFSDGLALVHSQSYLRLGIVAVGLLGILWATSWAAVRRMIGSGVWKAWHWLIYPALAAATGHVLLSPFVGAFGILLPALIGIILVGLRIRRAI